MSTRDDLALPAIKLSYFINGYFGVEYGFINGKQIKCVVLFIWYSAKSRHVAIHEYSNNNFMFVASIQSSLSILTAEKTLL